MKKFGLKTQGRDQRAGVDNLQTNGGSSLAISKAIRNLKKKVEPTINVKVIKWVILQSWASWFNQESFYSNNLNSMTLNWTVKIRLMSNRRRKLIAQRKVAVSHSIRISHLASDNNTKAANIATQIWKKGLIRSNVKILETSCLLMQNLVSFASMTLIPWSKWPTKLMMLAVSLEIRSNLITLSKVFRDP